MFYSVKSAKMEGKEPDFSKFSCFSESSDYEFPPNKVSDKPVEVIDLTDEENVYSSLSDPVIDPKIGDTQPFHVDDSDDNSATSDEGKNFLKHFRL